MADLKVAQDTLKGVQEKIARLEAEFTGANDKKVELERQMEEATGRLDRAEVLTKSLGSEQVRWTEAAAASRTSSGTDRRRARERRDVAYAGAFTPDFRASWWEPGASRLWPPRYRTRRVRHSRYAGRPGRHAQLEALRTAPGQPLPREWHRHVRGRRF